MAMSPFAAVRVSLSLLVLTCLNVQSAGPPITCEAGTFLAGDPASVKCNFGTNITATRRSFSLARWPVDAQTGTIETDILLCPWSTEKNKHDCFVEMANYTFDGPITDHLTVRIKEVSSEHIGSYMCFFVPSEGTESHLCILRVKARATSTTTAKPETSTTDESGESQDLLSIILPCVFVIVGVIVSCVGVLAFLRRRRAERSGTGNNVESSENAESNKPLLCDSTTEKKSKEETLVGDFQLTNVKIKKLMDILDQEMAKGLNEATMGEADITMFPTFVSPLSGGSDYRDCLVLELSETRLEASLVRLQGNNARISKSAGFPIPDGIKCATVNQLFDFVADCTNEFIQGETFSVKLPLALIFGFPCKHESVDKPCIVKWTKELNYSGTNNGDLRTLLAGALDRRAKENKFIPRALDNLRKLDIVAVVNDAVSTLMSVATSNSICKIGLVLDSGFNASYVEDWTNAEMCSTATKTPLEMIINTELGALGENSCLDFCRTNYDNELDGHSSSPGSQILEKMVGGRYIGELVRLVLEGLTRNNLLFQKVPLACALFKRASFSTGRVIIIEGDTDEPYEKTSRVLDGLGVTDYTEDDLKTVRLVCRTVCERAAYLAAASLATLINHIKQPEVTVVVDGFLYQRLPRFHDLMYSKTLELITPGLKFYLESPNCDRSIGAARIAASSLRSRETCAGNSDTPQRRGSIFLLPLTY